MIIGISGKKQSGKDLTGKILQALTNKPQSFDGMSVITEDDVNYKVWDKPRFETKKFADKLKDITCLLIGCTREQLENEEFKNSSLGEEWDLYDLLAGNNEVYARNITLDNLKNNHIKTYQQNRYRVVKMTPRKMLQLLGTECGRQIIHPEIWVNSLFSDCIPTHTDHAPGGFEYPNWVITDVRFPNEAKAIKDRNGLLVRLESNRCDETALHLSETALDNYGGVGNEVIPNRWDKVIYNNGTIKDLVDQVKRLIKIKNIK